MRFGRLTSDHPWQTYELARHDAFIGLATLAALAGATTAAALSCSLAAAAPLDFHVRSDVVGWVTAHDYPKPQEVFYFVATLTLALLGAAMAWSAWLTLGHLLHRLSAWNHPTCLRCAAYPLLGGFLAAPGLGTDGHRAALAVLCSLTTVAVLVTAVLLAGVLASRDGAPQEENNAPGIPFQQPPVSPQPSFSATSEGTWTHPAFGLACGFHVGLIVLSRHSPSTTLGQLAILITAAGLGAATVTIAPSARTALLILATAATFLAPGLSASTPLVLAALAAAGSLAVAPLVAPASSWNTRALEVLLLPLTVWLIRYDPFIDYPLDLFHEGEWLAPAQAWLDSKVPYRDIWLFHGLWYDYFRAPFAFHLFGTSVAAVRVLNSLTEPLGAIACYFMARRLLVTRTAPLLLVLFLTGMEVGQPKYPLNDSHALAYLSLLFLFVHIDCRRPWPLLLAGIVNGFTLFQRVDMGAFQMVATLIWLTFWCLTRQAAVGSSRATLRYVATYLLGLVLGIFPFFVYLARNGAWTEFLHTSFVVLPGFKDAFDGLAFPPFRFDPPVVNPQILSSFLDTYGPFYLPILIYAVASVYLLVTALLRRYHSWHWKVLLLLLCGFVHMRTAFGRSDLQHLIGCTGWALLLLVATLERGLTMQGRSALRRRLALLATVVVCLLLHFTYRPVEELQVRLARIARQYHPPSDLAALNLDRAGRIRVPVEQAATLQAVVTFIRTHTKANETLFDFSNQGAWYFLSNRSNPTRYTQVAFAATVQMQRELVEDLRAKPPKLVVWKSGTWFDGFDGIPNEQRHPIVASYLTSQYAEVWARDGVVILAPRSPDKVSAPRASAS